MTEFNVNDFGADVIESAIETIKSYGMNRVYCCLTGRPYAEISDSEIHACLRQELDRQPLAGAENLVDSFQLRYFALSSSPAPSLRVHKDRKTLLRILRSDPDGPSKLFAYMSGRLFFESLVPERLIGTLDNRAARLEFLNKLNARLNKLPANWSQSLTPEDELAASADDAIGVLRLFSANKPSIIEEGKAAQESLEILTRLDAIHNLRHGFYSAELRERLEQFPDSDDWNFILYRNLLRDLEQDGIVRLMKRKTRPMGHAMAISTALETLNWTRRRHGMSREKYMEAIEKAGKRGKFGIGVTNDPTIGAHLVSIQSLLEQPSLSRKDKLDLESVLKQLQKGVEYISPDEKRLESLRTYYTRVGNIQSKVTRKTVSPAAAVKHRAEGYLDAGKEMPEELRKKIQTLKDEGAWLKPETKESMSIRKQKSIVRAQRINKIKSLFAGASVKSPTGLPDFNFESKKDEE